MSFIYKSLFIFILTIPALYQTHAHTLDSLRMEKINGKRFIIHRAEPQETLYAISRRYNVTVDEIQQYNPSLSDGLKMYTELKIPYNKTTQKIDQSFPKTHQINSDQSQTHIVAQGETLFAISRLYNISVDSLKAYNHLYTNSLSVGDTLVLGQEQKIAPSPATQKQSSTPLTGSRYHVVQPSETLFGISRTYDISVDSLRSYNQLMSNSLSIGDTLDLGMNPRPNLTTPTSPQESAELIDSSLYHFVQPSETLFRISKTYDVDLDTLVAWNHLESYNLDIGQKLIISERAPSMTQEEVKEEETKLKPKKKKQPLDTIFVKTDNAPIKTKASVNSDGKVEIQQEGFAMEIQDTDHTTKYLALHRDAAPGTKIRVTNQMNGNTVVVRVVGILPETGLNKNVMIRISHAAFEGLGGIDIKVPVKSKYVEQ
ncbi:LysM peptidoglycan-binding domain-containing protein [Reichenbachiella agariperforans]|uniref:LysM peptidoglycan-binding domain-containing protein n=1 Tax=Reichenbachiella agariperforans TaxID=156994 RepID=UPI001C09EE0F|nr:LysM peptidoglycan-binding domain-containing protein [Reichenbachiella agariperforans]MBU2916227.1 LysM peptidoglycan-binding domain-containing protein [Reichenbachiella agariperforans]